ncbi:LOW QUALITY PROTEIN: hypothetical protein ACG7TL_001908 [Trametes sanguinea]
MFYKVELAANGLENGTHNTLTVAERLRMLKMRTEAWDDLAWTAREEVPMLQGGVWELYGGVLGQAEGSRTLVFNQLPSNLRGIEGRQWRIEDVGVNIRDFGMDPAQDLLIIIENRVDGGRFSYTIQVSKDYVAVLLTSGDQDRSELLIWNWKTGQRRLYITGSELSSFAFLTDQYILLTSLPTMELDDDNIFHGEDPRLFVIDLERMSNRHEIDFSDLDWLCAFHYPALGENFATISMSIRSDPAPNWAPKPEHKVPFHVARQDRLFVITLWVVQGNMHILPFISLVPSWTLLDCIRTLSPGETLRVFDWSDWGPRGSRLIPAPPTHTSVWVCYVYGLTFALSIRQGTQRGIVTFDFNQHAVRRAQAQEEREKAEMGPLAWAMQQGTRRKLVQADDRLFHPPNVFKDEIRTSLPYILRKAAPFAAEEGEGHFDAVMVSEDSLILVSSGSPIESTPPLRTVCPGPRVAAMTHQDEEHLFEVEVDEHNRALWSYTQGAKDAQARKWRRLFDLFAAEDDHQKIPFAAEGFTPWMRAYGWAFPRSYQMKFAKRHNIEISLDSGCAAIFSRKSILFGALTEQDEEDDQLQQLILAVSLTEIRRHLQKLAGIELELRKPFMSEGWWMFCIYDNYNYDQKRKTARLAGQDIDDVVEVLNFALKAADPTIEARWWYDWDELEVTTLAKLLIAALIAVIATLSSVLAVRCYSKDGYQQYESNADASRERDNWNIPGGFGGFIEPKGPALLHSQSFADDSLASEAGAASDGLRFGGFAAFRAW